jgi:SecD/SecF fusion protein
VTTSTVAALLTILGYSLYDTVIVFDRIRENVPRMPRATFSQIANRSMSEVFTRSLATSFVVLMPVGSLLLFGGDTLKDFAFALLVGVASGAYSSIFIATPVLVEWKEREAIYMRRRRLVMEENGGIVPPFASETIGESPEEAGLEPRERRAARRAQRRRTPARPPAETGTAATAVAPPPEAPPEPEPQPEPQAERPPDPEPKPEAKPNGDGAEPPAPRRPSSVSSTAGSGSSTSKPKPKPKRPRKKHGRR